MVSVLQRALQVCFPCRFVQGDEGVCGAVFEDGCYLWPFGVSVQEVVEDAGGFEFGSIRDWSVGMGRDDLVEVELVFLEDVEVVCCSVVRGQELERRWL